MSGADPGFQVRGGGGTLKKIAPSGGRRENVGDISCEKSRFYAKKSCFFSILGGTAPVSPGCTGLNADLYRVYLKDDPRCVCGHLLEDAIHFFSRVSRTSLFNRFNNIVPISL